MKKFSYFRKLILVSTDTAMEVESSDKVGYAGYQIDQHEKHKWIIVSHMNKFLNFKKLILVSTDTAMEVESSDEVGHAGYQIDQREKHK